VQLCLVPSGVTLQSSAILFCVAQGWLMHYLDLRAQGLAIGGTTHAEKGLQISGARQASKLAKTGSLTLRLAYTPSIHSFFIFLLSLLIFKL
jgi:hypothetical protein